MKEYITPSIKVKEIEMGGYLLAASQTEEPSENLNDEETVTPGAKENNNSFGTWDE